MLAFLKLTLNNLCLLNERLFQNNFEINRQRYVLDIFHSYFEDLEKLLIGESFKDVFKNELKNGNPIIYNFITFHYDEKQQLEYKDLIENFVDRNGDGLPF